MMKGQPELLCDFRAPTIGNSSITEGLRCRSHPGTVELPAGLIKYGPPIGNQGALEPRPWFLLLRTALT
jgi:hypothetical protein